MVTTENGSIKPVSKFPALSYVRADDLNAMKIEQPFFVVEKILPVGLCLLASPPKFGKSWFVLDLCVSVSTGSRFLGFATSKADSLYLALEDSNVRLQDRMRKVLNGRNPPKGLSMAIHSGTLQRGLIEQLETHIADNPKTKLIVIDTFQKVRETPKRGESAYSMDYRECGVLKAFADSKNVCLLLVHHMRKMQDASDTFSNISGTAGLSGAADTMLTMSRDKRTDEDTKLSIVGRDVEMQDYMMQFNKDIHRWHILGTVDEAEGLRTIDGYNKNPLVLTIRKLLSQNRGEWSGSVSEIMSASKYFQNPIYGDVRKVGRGIEQIQALLWQQDNIIYEPVKNGTGAKKHKFSVQNVDQDK